MAYKEYILRKVVSNFLRFGGLTSDTVPYKDERGQHIYRYGYDIGTQLIEKGVDSYRYARIYSYTKEEEEMFNQGMKAAFNFRRR